MQLLLLSLAVTFAVYKFNKSEMLICLHFVKVNKGPAVETQLCGGYGWPRNMA